MWGVGGVFFRRARIRRDLRQISRRDERERERERECSPANNGRTAEARKLQWQKLAPIMRTASLPSDSSDSFHGRRVHVRYTRARAVCVNARILITPWDSRVNLGDARGIKMFKTFMLQREFFLFSFFFFVSFPSQLSRLKRNDVHWRVKLSRVALASGYCSESCCPRASLDCLRVDVSRPACNTILYCFWRVALRIRNESRECSRASGTMNNKKVWSKSEIICFKFKLLYNNYIV